MNHIEIPICNANLLLWKSTCRNADLQNCKFCGISMLQRYGTIQKFTKDTKIYLIIPYGIFQSLNYTKLFKKSASADLNLRKSAYPRHLKKISPWNIKLILPMFASQVSRCPVIGQLWPDFRTSPGFRSLTVLKELLGLVE